MVVSDRAKLSAVSILSSSATGGRLSDAPELPHYFGGFSLPWRSTGRLPSQKHILDAFREILHRMLGAVQLRPLVADLLDNLDGRTERGVNAASLHQVGCRDQIRPDKLLHGGEDQVRVGVFCFGGCRGNGFFRTRIVVSRTDGTIDPVTV